MHEAESVAPVVLDVLGPGPALHVDEHEGLGLDEAHRHDGGEVAGGVAVREKVRGETRVGGVLDGPDVLHVSGVLAFARHPDHLQQKKR